MEYYVRNNDVWVLDNELDKQMFIKDNDVLCNIDYSCIYNTSLDDKCISTEVSKDTIIQNTLKGIIDQFDEKYEISQAELNTHITNKMNYFNTLKTSLFKRKVLLCGLMNYEDFMKKEFQLYHYTCIEKSKEEQKIDEIISKEILVHLENFFDGSTKITKKKPKTRKAYRNKRNQTHKNILF
jgi:hypothetical protein